ncbi:MAG: DUF4432 family protein [Planctomycetota bacterium]
MKRGEITIVGPRGAARERVIGSEELGLSRGGNVTIRVMHGGREEGGIEIGVHGGEMEAAIVATRGMGIWWARYRGKDLFWRSPVREAAHPRYIHGAARGGVGWLAGFCEGVARCGLGWMGAPGVDEAIDDCGKVMMVDLPLHGQIANSPASTVSVRGMRRGGRSWLCVTGVVYEITGQLDKYRLISETRVEMGGNEIVIHDEVTNLSGERVAPIELLYHINVGPPALGKGSRLLYRGEAKGRDERATKNLARHTAFEGRTKNFAEECVFIDLAAKKGGETGAMVVAPGGEFAVYELHNKRQLACFTEWKQTGMDEYACGLEPGTALPNNRAVERAAGRLEFLSPGETRKFDVVVGAVDTRAGVREMGRRVRG